MMASKVNLQSLPWDRPYKYKLSKNGSVHFGFLRIRK